MHQLCPSFCPNYATTIRRQITELPTAKKAIKQKSKGFTRIKHLSPFLTISVR